MQSVQELQELPTLQKERRNMRNVQTSLALFTLTLALGCGREAIDHSSQITAMQRDLHAAAKRVETLEADVLATQKSLINEQATSEALRRRLAVIEAKLSTTHEPEPIALARSTRPPSDASRGGPRLGTSSGRMAPIPEPDSHDTPHGPRVITLGTDSPSSRGSSDSSIRAHCQTRWPDDFSMREFCEGQQKQARQNIAARSAASAGIPHTDFASIRRHCGQRWPTDLSMQDFCETQQIEARRKLP